MNTVDKNTYSPEQIYNMVLEDNGNTNADELAKQFGLRNHGQILQRIGQHILSSMQKGINLSYPKLNVPLPTVRKTRKLNVAYRSGVETKLQISAAKLKELGNFDEVSTFEITTTELNGENVLVFKPVAFFGNNSNPTSSSTSSSSGSNTVGSGSSNMSSSSFTNSNTPTEISQAIPESTTVEISSFDDIPNTVTSSSNVPSVEETEDEEELNPNMI